MAVRWISAAFLLVGPNVRAMEAKQKFKISKTVFFAENKQVLGIKLLRKQFEAFLSIDANKLILFLWIFVYLFSVSEYGSENVAMHGDMALQRWL